MFDMIVIYRILYSNDRRDAILHIESTSTGLFLSVLLTGTFEKNQFQEPDPPLIFYKLQHSLVLGS